MSSIISASAFRAFHFVNAIATANRTSAVTCPQKKMTRSWFLRAHEETGELVFTGLIGTFPSILQVCQLDLGHRFGSRNPLRVFSFDHLLRDPSVSLGSD